MKLQQSYSLSSYINNKKTERKKTTNHKKSILIVLMWQPIINYDDCFDVNGNKQKLIYMKINNFCQYKLININL